MSAEQPTPRPEPPPPCALCGSTHHSVGHHDSAEPRDYDAPADGGPPSYATEVVHVDDDDKR